MASPPHPSDPTEAAALLDTLLAAASGPAGAAAERLAGSLLVGLAEAGEVEVVAAALGPRPDRPARVEVRQLAAGDPEPLRRFVAPDAAAAVVGAAVERPAGVDVVQVVALDRGGLSRCAVVVGAGDAVRLLAPSPLTIEGDEDAVADAVAAWQARLLPAPVAAPDVAAALRDALAAADLGGAVARDVAARLDARPAPAADDVLRALVTGLQEQVDRRADATDQLLRALRRTVHDTAVDTLERQRQVDRRLERVERALDPPPAEEAAGGARVIRLRRRAEP
jgi:hypothetical protein